MAPNQTEQTGRQIRDSRLKTPAKDRKTELKHSFKFGAQTKSRTSHQVLIFGSPYEERKTQRLKLS